LRGPNSVEGYRIGPGSAVVYVGPYLTSGNGTGGGFYSGGLGEKRARENDLYINNVASDNITHFNINGADCTLTLGASPYPSGDTSVFAGDVLAVTPNGKTMFVGSTGDLHIYSLTVAFNGSLGAPLMEVAAPDIPTGIEVSPDGNTLVVTYQDISQVCAYPVSSGHLGAANCQTTANFPAGVSIDPASACVYVGEENGYASEVAALPLTAGILEAPTDYMLGAGENSSAVLVNWNNTALYVSNQYSANVTTDTIASGCALTYQAIIQDGVTNTDHPGQIAQAKMTHRYMVTGDSSFHATPGMGIFHAHTDGALTPIGAGQFPLIPGADPVTVVVVSEPD
jgi:DNA-binding beta-propeller fold protein YncE